MTLCCSLCCPGPRQRLWRAHTGPRAGSVLAIAPSQTMKAHGVRNIVFSSSATVYGDPKYLPLDEKHPVGGCTNPYGKSKFFIEEMIRDLCKAERVRSRPRGCSPGVSPRR